MPSFMATMGLDATGIIKGLDQLPHRTNAAGAKILASLNKSSQQIGAAMMGVPQGSKEYNNYVQALISNHDKMREVERRLDVEAATRRNQTRALHRQRGLDQERKLEEAHAKSFAGRAGKFFSGVAGQFVGIGAAIGAIYKTKEFIADSIRVDIAMQRMFNTLKTVSGSAAQAQKDMDFLRSSSNNLGFSFLESGSAFARFSVAAQAANVTSEETRRIFLSVQQASLVMGLSTEQTSAAMLALEQMLSKGTVMCYDWKTEVLTKHGWQKWSQVGQRDTLLTRNLANGDEKYVKPTTLTVQPYSGPMIRVMNPLVDLLVTPDHRMVARLPNKDAFEIVRADELFGKECFFRAGSGLARHVKAADWLWNNYDGIVYCASVEYTTLLVRRNGKPVWSGNSQELRLQLGNAVPGSVNIFARALGLSAAQLYEYVEKGLIPAARAVKLFATELDKSFKLTPEANRTQRDIVTMTNSITELKAAIGQGLRVPVQIIVTSASWWAKSAAESGPGGFGAALKKMVGLDFIQDIAQQYTDWGTASVGGQYSAQGISRASLLKMKTLRDKVKAGEKAEKDKFTRDLVFRDAQLAAQKEAEKLAHLQDRLVEKQQETAFKAMPAEQQIQELLRRRAGIFQAGMDTKSAAGRAQAGIDIEEIDQELADLRREKETPSRSKRTPFSIPITEWQKAGAYIPGLGSGGLAVTQTQIGQRQLAATERIYEAIRRSEARDSRRGHQPVSGATF